MEKDNNIRREDFNGKYVLVGREVVPEADLLKWAGGIRDKS